MEFIIKAGLHLQRWARPKRIHDILAESSPLNFRGNGLTLYVNLLVENRCHVFDGVPFSANFAFLMPTLQSGTHSLGTGKANSTISQPEVALQYPEDAWGWRQLQPDEYASFKNFVTNTPTTPQIRFQDLSSGFGDTIMGAIAVLPKTSPGGARLYTCTWHCKSLSDVPGKT